MAMNSAGEYSITNYLDVAWHGIPLDAAVAGYLIAIPLLLTIVSTFVYIPMRKLLIVYNAFTAIAISSAFIADISLYPFWEFKLDASFLIYIDSPSNAFASVSTAYIATRLIAAIILAAAIFLLLHKATPLGLRRTKHRFISLFTTLSVGALLFLVIRGGVGESTNNIGRVYYSDKQFLNHSAVNPIFSFIYSMGKRENYKETYSFYTPEELAALTEGLFPNDPAITDTLLNTTRPNIITISNTNNSSNTINIFPNTTME